MPTADPPPAAAPRRTRRLRPFLAGAVAAALLVVALGLGLRALGVLGGEEPEAASSPDSAQEHGEDGGAPPPDGTELKQLRDEAWEAHSADLDGQWVVQLSSMQNPSSGDAAQDGETLQLILDKYEEFKDRYPDAALLWSGDWSTYANDGYWVVVRSSPFPDAESALDECAADGWGRDDCIATRLFITDAPEHTTEYMP
ncbi:hypothetical protein [Brevibacterium salitolerans]|uniref:hypothetical protein n=1 Tax=Brevibacterium salitolerans TaxID=1403566 RepID=UPI0031DD9D78